MGLTEECLVQTKQTKPSAQCERESNHHLLDQWKGVGQCNHIIEKTHTRRMWAWNHSLLTMRPQWNSIENSITGGLSFRETNHQEKTWTWAQMFNPQNETRGNLSCYKGFNDQRFSVTKRK